MNTKISSKLAALGMALAMNGFIFGAIAHVFDARFLNQVQAASWLT